MPAFVLPQILLCGLLVPRDDMAPLLDLASYALPLTYAYDALGATTSEALGSRVPLDVAVTSAATLLARVLGATTLRRPTERAAGAELLLRVRPNAVVQLRILTEEEALRAPALASVAAPRH